MDRLSRRCRCGVLQQLQLKDRVTRCQILECVHCRSLRHRKKALHLAGKAVEIGFEDRRAQAGRKLRYGIAAAAHRTDESNFACRAGIAHSIRIAACADEIPPPVEIEQIDRQGDRSAALAPAHFEHIEVAADEADADERGEHAAEDSIGSPRPEIASRIPGHRFSLSGRDPR